MSNAITADGIQTDTLTDIVGSLTTSFTTIYGPDTDLNPNSPDGQIINDFAQMVIDELDLTVTVYTSFDPDQAFGVTLDQRCAINGVKRLPGTYSTTDETIVTSGACSLVGLDGAAPTSPPTGLFIVADAAGNQWCLVNSFDIGSAGATILTFQAMALGAVTTTANTLTIPVTIVVGVTSVNNPTSQLSVGANEETDSALRIRRSKSVAQSAVGFYDALVADLESIPGVTTVEVIENDTGSTVNSVPGHSIWVIVGGTAADVDIATAIYAKRSAGCGMFGSQSFAITRLNGPDFTVFWDDVTAERLYTEFQMDAITGDLSTTGSVSSSSSPTHITSIASSTGWAAGYIIRGTGIPVGTILVSRVSSSEWIMSNAATGTHSAESITVVPIVASALATAIAAAFSANANETLNVGMFNTLIQSINPNVLATSLGLSSDGISYVNILAPTAPNYQFTLASGDIAIT